MKKESIPTELVTLIRVLGDGGDLRDWFLRLESLSDGVRFVEINRLTARMQAGGEESALVAAIALLADPQMYRSARLALRDCYGI